MLLSEPLIVTVRYAKQITRIIWEISDNDQNNGLTLVIFSLIMLNYKNKRLKTISNYYILL